MLANMITVTVKTVKQQTVKVDVEETATTLDLKGKIQESLGAEYPADNQKLIFKGKILQDTAIVGEIGLTETGFVVVMVTKPKTPIAPVAEPAPSSATPAPSQPVASPSDAPAPPEGASSGPDQSTEEKIDNLMEMTGNVIPRSQVAEVLERAQNNVSVAGALLSGGIEELLPGEGELTTGPQSAGGLQAMPGIPGATGNPLEFLRTQPQFQQLRDILKSDHTALQPILEQIRQTNPDLYELINSNREAFMRLINDPASGPSGTSAPSGPSGPSASGPSGPGPHQISVSPSDMLAITRLKDLGFSEQRAAEAYFACEKNEELAANFLISDDQPDF